MSDFFKSLSAGVAILIVGVLGLVIAFGLNYAGTYFDAKQEYAIQKMEDDNRYESLKKVEDHARGMISTYEADVLTYNQYKDSDNEEKQSWAEQAKMRANRTASNYNNYILKNSFVWENNVPEDISMELPLVE